MPARVLVVDDTPLNVKLLTDKLEYEDYVVSTAADGFEALAKIEAEKPDIVLLDVLMPPGIDGLRPAGASGPIRRRRIFRSSW